MHVLNLPLLFIWLFITLISTASYSKNTDSFNKWWQEVSFFVLLFSFFFFFHFRVTGTDHYCEVLTVFMFLASKSIHLVEHNHYFNSYESAYTEKTKNMDGLWLVKCYGLTLFRVLCWKYCPGVMKMSMTSLHQNFKGE